MLGTASRRVDLRGTPRGRPWGSPSLGIPPPPRESGRRRPRTAGNTSDALADDTYSATDDGGAVVIVTPAAEGMATPKAKDSAVSPRKSPRQATCRNAASAASKAAAGAATASSGAAAAAPRRKRKRRAKAGPVEEVASKRWRAVSAKAAAIAVEKLDLAAVLGRGLDDRTRNEEFLERLKRRKEAFEAERAARAAHRREKGSKPAGRRPRAVRFAALAAAAAAATAGRGARAASVGGSDTVWTPASFDDASASPPNGGAEAAEPLLRETDAAVHVSDASLVVGGDVSGLGVSDELEVAIMAQAAAAARENLAILRAEASVLEARGINPEF